MNKKQLTKFIILIFLFVVVALLAQFSFGPEKKVEIPQATPQAEEKLGKILVSANITQKESPQIEVFIEALEEKATLSAFALVTTISSPQNLEILKKDEAKVNSELVKEGWSFPLIKVKNLKVNEISFGISGYLLSQKPFYLDKKTLIAEIPLKNLPNEDLQITLDPDLTNFFKKDALTKIPVITQ